MFLQTLFSEPIFFFRIVVITIFSICLHELAHGWAALTQGDDTPVKAGHITLNPVVHMGWQSIVFLCIGGIAWGQMPINPSKFRFSKLSNILVSAAGPFMNLALSVTFVLLIRLLGDPTNSGVFSFEFFYLVAHINLVLFLFNLLPIPPLDGFHVFSELFPVLKPLGENQLGLMLMMILFLVPGVGRGLSAVASFVIQLLVG